MSSKKLRAAVIGVGHFGAYHAEKYASLADAQLVAVADIDAGRAQQIGQRFACPAVTDFRDILKSIDIASVCVPTAQHFDIAMACLEAGVHVLIEKPMTASLPQADQLIAAAEARGLNLQVGYLERFALNAAGLDRLIDRPLFIECNRLAPFKPRSLDISVVYDLMIHDIDMVLAMTQSPLESVDAVGAPVLSKLEDIANTRLRFRDGCVANITASRISVKTERKMRIFQADGYLSVDFLARKVNRVRRLPENGGAFDASESDYAETDTLKAEIESFIASVRANRPPEITGSDGRRAQEVAQRIEESLNAHRLLLQSRGYAPIG